MNKKITPYQKIKSQYALYQNKKAYFLKSHKRYQKALKAFLKSMKTLNETPKDLYHLGDIYFHLRQYKKALTCFIKAKEMTEIEKERQHLNRLIGFCYREMNDFPKFIEYGKKQLEVEEDKPTLLLDLSQAYRLLKEYEKALIYAKEALRLYESDKKNSEVAYCYLRIGHIFIDKKEYKKAIDCLEKTEMIYDQISIKSDDWCHLYQILEFTYHQIGYIDTAHFYKSKFNKITNLKNA